MDYLQVDFNDYCQVAFETTEVDVSPENRAWVDVLFRKNDAFAHELKTGMPCRLLQKQGNSIEGVIQKVIREKNKIVMSYACSQENP